MNNVNAILEIVKSVVKDAVIETVATREYCAVKVRECLKDSKWRGTWTETIREAVAGMPDGAKPVHVKPLSFDRGTSVWYRIMTA